MKYSTLALIFALAGCNFHLSGDNGGAGGGDDLAAGGDDLGDVDLGGGGNDLTTANDIAGLPIVCTAGSASCNGGTLVSCPDGTAEMMTTCSLGCSTTNGAHCEQMYPRAPVARSDFDTTGLTDITINMGGGISTDNGQINAGNNIFRHPNTDANAYEVHDGIGFHVVSIPGQTTRLGIFTFKSLTIPQGQSFNTYGSNGLALVSAGNITLAGTVDVTCAANVFVAALGGAANAKPYLGGPGGGNGGIPGGTSKDGVSIVSGGGGAGADITHQAGGGGGAFGDIGGPGGDEGANTGGAGGLAYGDGAMTMLLGGSGGGAGGLGGVIGDPNGGGGGGIALVVAQGTLTLGGGNMVGGVNAGGCGGGAATGVGGGGGGAGGAVYLQALAVHITNNGGVAANGGGGGAANTNGGMSSGKSGTISTTAAGGGSGGSASGGAGGVVGSTDGKTGGSSAMAGAGGGGGVGRVRIETQSGAATIDGNGIQSPNAIQGTIDIH